MANLTITAGTPAGGAQVPVVIQLVDADRNPISAFNATLGLVVSTFESRTNSAGTVTVDIPANSTYDVTGTRYVVQVGEFSRLILKTGSSQTLAQAMV